MNAEHAKHGKLQNNSCLFSKRVGLASTRMAPISQTIRYFTLTATSVRSTYGFEIRCFSIVLHHTVIRDKRYKLTEL